MRKNPTSAVTIPLELVKLEQNSFHLLINVEIDGIQGDMIVDTGASVTVVDEKIFSHITGDATKDTKMQSGTISGQISGIRLLKARELKIGGQKIRNVKLAALDLDYVNEMYGSHLQRKIIGLLGCDFFVRHKTVIDYGTGTLSFKKKSAPKKEENSLKS